MAKAGYTKKTSVDLETAQANRIGQMQYAIEAFVMYVQSALSSKLLNSAECQKLKSKAVNLLEKINNKTADIDQSSDQFNVLIDELNNYLPAFPNHANYPKYEADNLKVQIESQLIAYQGFLYENLAAQKLAFDDQSVFFRQTFKLWENVYANRLTPQKGISSLAALIQKVNGKLSKEEQHPLPNDKFYVD